MNGLEFHERIKGVAAELEKEPRHLLAWMLAFEWITRKIIYAAPDLQEQAFSEAVTRLRASVKETRGLSKSVLLSRRIRRTLDKLQRGAVR